MRILFVDDCIDDAIFAGLALRNEGFAFEERIVATCEEVEDALRDGPWSAVISDYNLAEGTGLDVLRIVREHDPDVPFLLVSGTIGEERAAEAIREGVQDYVMKDRMVRLPGALRRELEAARSRAEQRRLEARLRRVEERYRRTCEEAPVGIANCDATGMLLNVNAHFCTLLGYTQQELIGRPEACVVHPDELAHSGVVFGDLFAGRIAAAELERRYVRKDGSVMWASVKLSAVRDAEGVLDYVIALVEDISGKKETREKLLLQSRLLECVEQAVIATDAEGRVIFWNRFAEKLYGWSAEEAQGRKIVDLTPAAETRAEADEILWTLLAKGESWSGEILLRHRDGTTFPAWIIDAPLLDEHGRLAGFVGVSYDRTQQNRVENDLREHKLQLEMAQAIAGTGSWTVDVKTGARRWSDNLCRMYGIDPETSLEEAFNIIHPEDRQRIIDLQQRALRMLEPVETEFRIVLSDGATRTLSTRFAYICDDDGNPTRGVGVVHDVTAAKAAEQELRRRAWQQSSVANLGQIALSGASLRFLFEQAVAAIGDIMDVEVRGIFRKQGDSFVVVEGVGPGCDARGAVVQLGDDSQTQYTIRHGAPVVLTDAATETRFVPAPEFVARGVVSGITVPIYSADGSTWGVLFGFAREQRRFPPHDIDFLRAVASIIGQANDRADADAELRTRARQQSAIAELGRLVLTSIDANVFEKACELLAFGIGAEFAFYSEVTQHDTLRRIAGKPWSEDLPVELAISKNAQAGYTFLTGEAVVVDDYRTEERFDTRDLFRSHGILSGAMVQVAGAKRVFGVLSAQSREAGHFTPSDIDFLQSLANVLAEAMEREMASEAVLESELRYRRIFEGATEMIFTIDKTGHFIALSAAFETITGMPREEWLGCPFIDLLAPYDRERVLRLFEQMLVDGQPASADMTLLGSAGPAIVDVSSFTKRDNGEVTEVYGFARDVTEERRIERERERVTRNLQLLLESTVEGIFTVDVGGRCTMVNRAAAAYLGHEPEELLGASVHELSASLAAALHDGEPHTSHDDTFRRRDGTLIPVTYSAAPIVDAGQCVGAVVTFTDLTERRKLEARLEQANRLSSLGRLAATVAHEFNNVLMGISPFVEVVRRSTDPVKIASSLEYIASSVKRGRRVTQDILRFTQPAEPVRTAVDLHLWLQSVGTEAGSMLSPSYRIHVNAEPLAVHADSNQLHQIFMNLILNARDAMPRGGTISISARSERADARFAFGHVDDPSRYAHIAVADTGVGMNEETLRHAFEPLFTTKKSGTGLGLAVTHQVVQRHGGEIFIESTAGAGTTFHIFLPLSEREAVDVPQGGGEMPQEQTQKRVLLVEDDESVASGIMTLLELEGFAVEHVTTGTQALAAVNRRRPDVVLLDVGLPDMDGKSVFTGISAHHPSLPVIFSTGHADRGELEAALAHPHVMCLLKPYEGEALIEALESAMRSGFPFAESQR